MLIVTTKSPERTGHILSEAGRLMRNPDRALFYGVSLVAYVASTHAVTEPCLHDHRDRPVALVPDKSACHTTVSRRAQVPTTADAA